MNNIDRVSLKNFQFNSAFGQQYSREFISHRGAVKLFEDDLTVRIAITNGNNTELIKFLESFHIPKKVSFTLIGKAELATFIGETTEIEPIKQSDSEQERTIALDSIIEGAPVLNIINAICIEAIRLESSDIHIEAHADSVNIRYRLDGILRIVKKIDISVFLTISNRIKIMANLNPLEKRLPQDGRMSVSVENQNIDLRVSIIPITNGESIVMRIFNKSTKLLPLDDLGFYLPELTKIKNIIKQPYGLLLLTGPTGSGKTTTLHALLATLPVDNLKIVTIEDPVEQIIPNVNQIQINEEIDLTFDNMLRRVLRQDPNVIMVGEIRDNITAELALRSALTGHLILSTLHTNDAVSVITRLQNMDLEPYLIAAVLRCSVAQRLVRKLCPICRKRIKADKNILSLLSAYKIAGDINYEPTGCEACEFTGYCGRTIIGEVFIVDKTIEDMIREHKSVSEIVKYASKNAGMGSMANDALNKVVDGITSFSEVEREVFF
jgi:general secretion pathway protein E/type IV pilus assembly protein PilB